MKLGDEGSNSSGQALDVFAKSFDAVKDFSIITGEDGSSALCGVGGMLCVVVVTVKVRMEVWSRISMTAITATL